MKRLTGSAHGRLSRVPAVLWLIATSLLVCPHPTQAQTRGALLDATSGASLGFPTVAGSGVDAAVPDGTGGWYIAGNFTTVGGLARSNLAHVLADNSVSAWNPGATGRVTALAVSGTTVYAGGEFTICGGQTRSRIAAIDATTGLATTWNPNSNSPVRCLAVSGTTVYAGGEFTNIGTQARSRIAALDATTGLATPWNPNASGGAFTVVGGLVVSGATVYASGIFTNIGGQPRNNIAALDATTGLATAWNPNANDRVQALAVSGATVYAGGAFTNIGGQARVFIAALDATTGLATSWNPTANNEARTLAVGGTRIYAGGFFTTIGGRTRNRIASLDAVTGLATSWNPNANGSVDVVAANGSTVFAGGSFTTIGAPAPPDIVSARDVGNDQGRQLRINLRAAERDAVGSLTPVVQYEAFRRIDPLPTAGAITPVRWKPNGSSTSLSTPQIWMRSDPKILDAGWEFVGAIPAHGMAEYNMIAPTLADSTVIHGMHWSVFFVRAATVDPLVFFDSAADSGYSLDNLAPASPQNLHALPQTQTGVVLTWSQVEEADFEHYTVYRDVTSDFVLDPSKRIGSTISLTFVDDSIQASRTYFYVVTAFDFAGNEGRPSHEVSAVPATSDVASLPGVYALRQNQPNPFNPSTVIEFDLPNSTRVQLRIFDVGGRSVRTLIDKDLPAGRHKVRWDGRDTSGSPMAAGNYLYRIQAGAFTETRKMVLLK